MNEKTIQIVYLSPLFVLFLLSLFYIILEFQNKKETMVLRKNLEIAILSFWGVVLILEFLPLLGLYPYFMGFDHAFLYIIFYPLTIVLYSGLVSYCIQKWVNKSKKINKLWLISSLIMIIICINLYFFHNFIILYRKLTMNPKKKNHPSYKFLKKPFKNKR